MMNLNQMIGGLFILPRLHLLLCRGSSAPPSFSVTFTLLTLIWATLFCGTVSCFGNGEVTAELHDLVPPIMISEPNSQIVLKKGSNYTLKCHAVGDPPPHFVWTKDYDVIKVGKDGFSDDGKIRIVSSGNTGNSDTALTLFGFDASLEGNYRCTAANMMSSAQSMGSRLIIPYLDAEFGPMSQLEYVADMTSPELNCEPPLGVPRPTISWQKDGRPLQLDGERIFTNNSGQTLIIKRANFSEHQGLYTCVASNTAGSRVSPQIKLVIEKIPMFIKLPPKQLTYTEGMNFSIPCETVGTKPGGVSWDTAVQAAIEDSSQVFLNREDNSLVVYNAKVSYSGVYKCIAKNEVGTAEASSKLTIQPAVDVNILVVPQSQEWFHGFTGTLDCRTKDQIITWTTPNSFNSKEELVTGQASASGKYYVTSEGTLFVYDVTMNDQGTYTCKNGISTVASQSVRTAKVVVNRFQAHSAPLIQLGSSDQRIVPGGRIILLCEATSQEKVTISWSKDGQPFHADASARYTSEPSGSLIIKNAIQSDAGEYTCTAKSPSGTTNQSTSIEIIANGGIERSYPVEELPGPPATAPYASFVNTSCVFLNWAAPVLNQDMIKFYRIEHYMYGLGSWTIVLRNINTTQTWVCNLRPGRTYVFVARARNDYGYGHASPISERITLMDLLPEKDESDIPILSDRVQSRLDKTETEVLEPIVLSPTSVRVSWMVLKYPTLVKGFRLNFASLTHYPTSASPNFEIIGNPNTRTHILTGLQPWTTYNISIQPYNKMLIGKLSRGKFRMALMPQMGPTAPPSNVENLIDSKKGILNISWSPPPRKDWNGELTGFNIRVYSHNTPDDKRRVIIDQNVSDIAYTVSLNVTTFNSEAVNIQLAAFNSGGVGVYSDPLILTNEDFGGLAGSLGGRSDGSSGSSSAKDFIWIYIGLGLLTIILVGAVIFLFWRNVGKVHGSKGGIISHKLGPLTCGEEKTYAGSMGSNGVGANDGVDVDSISPQSKLMANYSNLHPDMLGAPTQGYGGYHHSSNSPCSGAGGTASMNTPMHIDPPGGHHGSGGSGGGGGSGMLYNTPHSRMGGGWGVAPDLIRGPTPNHNTHPEYAEIPGVYESAAPSSMSSDNCAECQRERAALAAAAALSQHSMLMAATSQAQQHHQNNMQHRPNSCYPSYPTLIQETCLVGHSPAGMSGSIGAASSGTATPSGIHSVKNESGSALPQQFYSTHGGSGLLQPNSQCIATSATMMGGAGVQTIAHNPMHNHHFLNHAAGKHNHSTMPNGQQQQQQQANAMGGIAGGGSGNNICPPVCTNSQKYHQLATNAAINDYTKLDESISGDSDPESITPPPPNHNPNGKHGTALPPNSSMFNCYYPPSNSSYEVSSTNRHSLINNMPPPPSASSNPHTNIQQTPSLNNAHATMPPSSTGCYPLPSSTSLHLAGGGATLPAPAQSHMKGQRPCYASDLSNSHVINAAASPSSSSSAPSSNNANAASARGMPPDVVCCNNSPLGGNNAATGGGAGIAANSATTAQGGGSNISRPRMGISSTGGPNLGRSVASLPPYTIYSVNDAVC